MNIAKLSNKLGYLTPRAVPLAPTTQNAPALQSPLNSAHKIASYLLPEIIQPHRLLQPRLKNYADFLKVPLKMPPPKNDSNQSIKSTAILPLNGF